MKAVYIKGATLQWADLWDSLGLSRDKGGRWYAGDKSPKWVQEYCSQYRTPSRAFPHSHAKALLTQKFAKLLCEKDAELAVALKIATEEKEV